MFDTKIRWIRWLDNWESVGQLLAGNEKAIVHLNGHELLLIYHNEQYFMVKNKCPHQGVKLTNAFCEEGKIVCPWHRYAFDLETGRGAGLYLEKFPINEHTDGIYVGFEYLSWFG